MSYPYSYNTTPQPPFATGVGYYAPPSPPGKPVSHTKKILLIVGLVVAGLVLIGGIAALIFMSTRCKADGCHNGKMSGFSYCENHKCHEESCPNRVMAGKEYCAKHDNDDDSDKEKKKKKDDGELEGAEMLGACDGVSYWKSEFWDVQVQLCYGKFLNWNIYDYTDYDDWDNDEGEKVHTIRFAAEDSSQAAPADYLIVTVRDNDSHKLFGNNSAMYTSTVNGITYHCCDGENGATFFGLEKDGYYLEICTAKANMETVTKYGVMPEKAVITDITTTRTTQKTTVRTTSPDDAVYSPTIGYTTDVLNVRMDAGTNYGKVGLLEKGEQVTIVGEKNGFYKIEYSWSQNGSSGSYAYVSKDYVTLSDPNSGNGGVTQYQGKTITGKVVPPAVTDTKKLDVAIGYTPSAKPGDTVRIPVYVSNNPGIWGLHISWTYDSDKIELMDVELQGTFADEFDQMNGLFTAYGLDNITATGQIFWVTFYVWDDAPSGNAFINIDCIECIDADGNDVKTVFHNGCITVS